MSFKKERHSDQASMPDDTGKHTCLALQTRWVHSGRARVIYFFYRSCSGRTQAHLASLLLLCSYTRRAHMATVWNTDYIINIIHRLRKHALAYRWQLTMQSIRENLECGELLKVPNASGKAAFWISHAFDDNPDSLSPHWMRCFRFKLFCFNYTIDTIFIKSVRQVFTVSVFL